MLNCNETRDLLALDPLTDDPEISEHLETCEACTIYQRGSEALDVFVRPAFRWEAPTELTASLLALAANPSLNIRVIRPSRWYVSLVYALTVAVVALSLAVAWQFVSAMALQYGVGDMLIEILAIPGRAVLQLTETLPESRYVIDFFFRARDQLLWLLLVAILWATFDRWNLPMIPPQRPLA